MGNTMFSILLFVLGLIIGFAAIYVINFLKKKNDDKKADTIIDKAKKDTIKYFFKTHHCFK